MQDHDHGAAEGNATQGHNASSRRGSHRRPDEPFLRRARWGKAEEPRGAP